MMAGGASLAPRRWSLPALAPQAAQQVGVRVHRLHERAEEQQELRVLVRRRRPARAGSCRRRWPGDQLLCLPEPLTPAKGFSCSRQTRPCRSATFFIISITSWLWSGGDVRRREDRRHLELAGRHLVVLGLRGDAELPELDVELLHEGGDALLDGAEVVVLHLLALRRRRAEQRAAGRSEVEALAKYVLVDQEVLLLRADRGDRRAWPSCCRALAGRAAPASQSASMERSSGVFLSSASPCVGEERRRDAERHVPAASSLRKAGGWGPRRCSRGPRRWRAGRRTGRRRRPARPG